jgi:uncharacterized protein involved in exopolysaccharide biosynthesis
MSTVAPATESTRVPATVAGARTSRSAPELDRDISLIGALYTLLRRWQVVFGLPLFAAAVTGLVSLVVPPTYTAATTFVPEVRTQTRLPSAVAGLAGQFGVPLGIDPSQSPRFYGDVVRSRELLERVLLSRYPDPGVAAGTADSTTLLRILRVRGDNPADSLARGVKRLDELISVRVDAQTNIVRLTVDAHDATVAAAVTNRLVAYLNEFNTQRRQSQARERRRFTEQRVAAADSELRSAEEAVKTFYERNRGWQQAPDLVFEEGRLRRQVSVNQEVYLTLKRDYETARIDEVNDTPVITVIDAAVAPQQRSQPRPFLWIVVALLVGGLVSVSWALGASYVERAGEMDEPAYRALTGLLQGTRRKVVGAVRRVIRRS